MRSLEKKSATTTLAVIALVTAATGFAVPATAAPTGPSSADRIIASLKADGYDVILNRSGAAPLVQCTVSAVRPGYEVTRTDSGNPGDVLATTTVAKTVYVDLAC